MGEVTVQDPEEYGEFKADDRGRVSLGREYSGSTVTLVIEKKEDGDN